MSCTQRNLDYGSKSPTARVITNKRKCEKPSSAASRFAPWMRCGASRKHTSYLCCRLSEHAIQNTHRAVIVNTSASNCTHKNSMLIHCAYIWCVCVCVERYTITANLAPRKDFIGFCFWARFMSVILRDWVHYRFGGCLAYYMCCDQNIKYVGKRRVCVGNVR